MTAPSVVVSARDRTNGGSLLTASIQVVRGVMLKRGLAIIPSDNGYVLAGLAVDESSASILSSFSEEVAGPITITFASYHALMQKSESELDAVKPWLKVSLLAAGIIERLTPGPLAIVCEANSNMPRGFATMWTKQTQKVGVAIRIPDSIIERQVAGATIYPIATRQLLVREAGASRRPVVDFQEALKLVTIATDSALAIGWVAVEGDFDNMPPRPSTIVDTLGGEPDLVYEGSIPFEKIEAGVKRLPTISFEDWG